MITKALFASGLQCAKRLYLDYQHPDEIPEPSARRQGLAEIGAKLVELARAAFPESQSADSKNAKTAIEQTAKMLGERKPIAVFDGAFATDDIEVRTDIVIPDGSGRVDVYEVKSGAKIKKRHIRDLALQVHAIEHSGFEVRVAWILHLNSHYRHRGGSSYPVHELFKNVDVTDKVRKEVAKIGKRVADFQNVLDDPVTRELPTGTWCHLPFPCSHLPTCRREGPEHPLLDLPDLSRDQESEFHQQSIEELADVDPEHPGLTFVQRRALRALESGGLVVEEFVADELRDVEYPLHFIHATSLLQVLPTLEGCHPWQHMPFQWHDTILDKNGRAEQKRFVADGKSDPRPAFVSTLAEAVRGPGTLMLYGPTLEQRLRELLDDAPKQKAEVRAILNQARFDLRQLVRAGVYHPDFRASFELVDVHRSLVEESHANGPDIHDDDNAQAAFQRLLNSRTRATTREKLGRQLDAYGEQCSGTILALYRALSSTEPGT